jgi:predicted metal-dependent hydrolase
MSIEQSQITVSGLRVSIIRKAIKNLHLGVYPPNGRVRVAVPLAVTDDAVRLAVIGKLGWIKRQQARFKIAAATVPTRDGQRRESLLSGTALPFTCHSKEQRDFHGRAAQQIHY